jgi:GNAT superfamily N-acetyltransferase
MIVPGVHVCATGEYGRFKSILNRGSHPTYVGQRSFRDAAKQGCASIAHVGGQDVAAALVNAKNGALLTLCVVPEFRSQGVGAWFLGHLSPTFARVLDSAVVWFEAHGYERTGVEMAGRKHRTIIMIRCGLRALAGRLCDVLRNRVESEPTSDLHRSDGANVAQDPCPPAAGPRVTGGVGILGAKRPAVHHVHDAERHARGSKVRRSRRRADQ